MNINELKIVISEILEEAKKKKEKQILAKEASLNAISAYGNYANAFDFSAPLGAYNLYRQQGAVNWGPYTSNGPHIDSNFANPNTRLSMKESEEVAIRAIVREVIEHGLVPHDSAWAPMMERRQRVPVETPWQAALQECAWYMQHMETNGVPEGGVGGPKMSKERHTKYAEVKPHGPPPEDKGGKNKRVK